MLIAAVISLKNPSSKVTEAICKIILKIYDQPSIYFVPNTYGKIAEWSVAHSLCLESEFVLIGLKILHRSLKENPVIKSQIQYQHVVKIVEHSSDELCVLEAIQILQLVTFRLPDDPYPINKQCLSHKTVAIIQKACLKCLQRSTSPHSSIDCNILISSISTLFNLISIDPDKSLMRFIVNECIPYVFYGQNFIRTPSISSNSDLSIPELVEQDEPSAQGKKSFANRKHKKRQRRKKGQPLRTMIPNETRQITFEKDSCNTDVLKPQWMQVSNNVVASDVPKESKSFERTPEVFVNKSRVVEASDEALKANVRQCALHVINSAIENSGKQNKFAYWPQLMCQEPSIMNVILRDNDLTVRMAALQVVENFLTTSSSVFSLASDSSESRSFTTFSMQLGISLRALHRCLALALLSEKMPVILIRILKTVELLFENVNYSNLKPGLLTKLIVHVKWFLIHKDSIVMANAFSAIAAFLRIKPHTEELIGLLTKYKLPGLNVSRPHVDILDASFEEFYDEDSEEIDLPEVSKANSDDENKEEKQTVLWILQRCVDALLAENHVGGIYLQVKLKSMTVLETLVNEHFSLIKSNLPLIQHVISTYCSHQHNNPHYSEGFVIKRAFMLLGFLLNTVKGNLENADKVNALSEQDALELWLWAFQGPLAHVLQEDLDHSNFIPGNHEEKDHSLKIFISAASVLSSLSENILSKIGELNLNRVLSLLQRLVSSSEINVNLCGLKIAGVLVCYPTFKESIPGCLIVQKAVDLSCNVLLIKEITKKDRLLATWVLANISSSISHCRKTWHTIHAELFLEKDQIKKIFSCCLGVCTENDTTKPPAIRCIGHTVSYIPKDWLEDFEIEKYVEKSINALIDACDNSYVMKSRWSACYALGTILRCEAIDLETVPWLESLLKTLSSLIGTFKNLKVRILACSALCNISSRKYFGEFYFKLFKSFVKAFDYSRNIVGSQELQHRDELICQVSFTMCHLITLLTFDDIGQLESKLEITDDLRISLRKANKIISPEKAHCFINATEHIYLMLNVGALTSNQDIFLHKLLNIIKF